jgi:hypothetical protein
MPTKLEDVLKEMPKESLQRIEKRTAEIRAEIDKRLKREKNK